MTAPYSATILSHYGFSPLRYIATARVVYATSGLPIADLTMNAGSTLTFDETWAPYVQASLNVADPGIDFELRETPRLEVYLGYGYPNGQSEVYRAATLVITSYRRNIKDGTATITATSDEHLAQRSSTRGDQTLPVTELGAAIQAVLDRSLTPYVPTYAKTLPLTYPAFVTGYTLPAGDRFWRHLEAIRDAGNAVVYCDEARVWHIDPSVVGASPAMQSPRLVTGPAVPGDDPSVIGEFTADRDLDEWSNCVVLVHEWTAGGVANRVVGVATVTTGSGDPTYVGYAVHSERRTTAATVAQANAQAAALLTRLQHKSRRFTLTATACYWWRPRRRIDTTPNVGFYQRVTRVTFDLDGSGLMHITGREESTW